VQKSRATARAGALLIGALVLYFFANQTQVGWLYVMAAALAGLIPAAWLMNRAGLRGIEGEREVALSQDTSSGSPTDADAAAQADGQGTKRASSRWTDSVSGGDRMPDGIHEGDSATVRLRLWAGRRSAAQLRLTETCPLAAPDAPEQTRTLYIPSLTARQSVELSYEVTTYRRGVYAFAPLPGETRAPFGLFRRMGVVAVPTRVLVYPEVRALRRFALLDRQLAPEMARMQAGHGYEILGTRPYRHGDSPRHVHWRSTARTGQLISKEFADEAQPGLTLALDVFAHPYAAVTHKHTPFEMAVKIAAAIGAYARRKGYPLYVANTSSPYSLSADKEGKTQVELPVPSGMVTWEALLEYLAKVQPVGTRRLDEALAGAATKAFVAAILPYPDASSVAALTALLARGVRVLAVVIDAATFPGPGEALKHGRSDGTEDAEAGEPAWARSIMPLQAAGVDVRVVAFGDEWSASLEL
jgi:uncharacterized protein (DUF58 family)